MGQDCRLTRFSVTRTFANILNSKKILRIEIEQRATTKRKFY